jgi:hypothetical protein
MRLNNVVGQVIHHVPVGDLTIFGFLFSELRKEVGPSRFHSLLIVISRDFVFSDLVNYSALGRVLAGRTILPVGTDAAGQASVGRAISTFAQDFRFPVSTDVVQGIAR